MKCFFHNDRDATAVCRECGRCLCTDCVSGSTMAVCTECRIAGNAVSRKRIYINLAAIMIVFTVLVFMLHGLRVSDSLVLDFSISWKVALCVCLTVSGWRFLSGMQGYVFIGGGLFWLLYLYFKLAFSFIAGLVVGPYRVLRMIGELLLLHRSDLEIHAVQGEGR